MKLLNYLKYNKKYFYLTLIGITSTSSSSLFLSSFPSFSFSSSSLFNYSYCEEKKELKEENNEENIDEWEKEKRKCSLCKMFLTSPCRNEFITWAKCVDNAKAKEENFVEKCGTCFEPLLDCQSAHHDYFKEILETYESEHEEENQEAQEDQENHHKDNENHVEQENKETSTVESIATETSKPSTSIS